MAKKEKNKKKKSEEEEQEEPLHWVVTLVSLAVLGLAVFTISFMGGLMKGVVGQSDDNYTRKVF